jgi:hypothetical protein
MNLETDERGGQPRARRSPARTITFRFTRVASVVTAAWVERNTRHVTDQTRTYAVTSPWYARKSFPSDPISYLVVSSRGAEGWSVMMVSPSTRKRSNIFCSATSS